MSVFLQPIYTQTVGAGGAASITFNNIPQGFTDLVLYHSARDGRTDAPYSNSILTFNGNTNRVYSALSDSAVLTSVLPGQFLNEPWYFYNLYTAGQVATSNTFSNSSVYIPRYNSGNFKQVLMENMVANNSSGVNGNLIVLNAGLFRSTSPITSMTITSVNGVFAQYSSWTLYGVSERFDTAAPAAPTIGTVTDLGGVASIAFTANDSGTGHTADNYSVFDQTIMSAPAYAQTSPVIVPVTTGTTYNNLAVSANNAVGSGTSANPAGFTSVNNLASIATFAVSSSVATVSFTNIPQYYRHLMLRITGMSADATTRQLDMGFNNDGSQIYTFHQYYGGNTSVGSTSSAPRNDIPEVCQLPRNNQTKSAVSYLYLYDYNDLGKFKTVHWYLGFEFGTAGYVQQATGMYRSFAPVSMITLAGRGGNIGANSHIALYGIG